MSRASLIAAAVASGGRPSTVPAGILPFSGLPALGRSGGVANTDGAGQRRSHGGRSSSFGCGKLGDAASGSALPDDITQGGRGWSTSSGCAFVIQIARPRMHRTAAKLVVPYAIRAVPVTTGAARAGVPAPDRHMPGGARPGRREHASALRRRRTIAAGLLSCHGGLLCAILSSIGTGRFIHSNATRSRFVILESGGIAMTNAPAGGFHFST